MKSIFPILICAVVICLSCKSESSKSEDSSNIAEVVLDSTFSAGFLIGRDEEFKSVDESILNSRLITMDKEISVGEVAQMLFLPGTFKGNENIAVQYDTLENGNMMAIIIHDQLPNQYMEAEKFVMILRQNGEKWKIVSLKKNWKCKKGQSWGIRICN